MAFQNVLYAALFIILVEALEHLLDHVLQTALPLQSQQTLQAKILWGKSQTVVAEGLTLDKAADTSLKEVL